jgi:predicted phage-related endonuclease
LYSEKISPVREVGFIVRDFGDFKIGYSPDGLVDDGDGLIEIKCQSRNVHVKGIISGEIPAMYTMQMQTGMLVTGRKWCDYVAYFNGMKLNVIRMYADKALQNLIVEAVGVFEKRVVECIEIYNEKTKQMPMAELIEELIYE